MVGQRLSISVLIAAYNEERRLSPTLAEIVSYLSDGKFEIKKVIVVDDGSKDRTAERAFYFVDKLPLEIVRLEKNVGKWGAVAAGLKCVGKDDLVLLLDADGAASIYELDKLFSLPKRGAGVAIMGTRFSKSSEVVAKTGLRTFLSVGYRVYVRFLLWFATGKWGLVDDTQCPFKLFYAGDVDGEIEERRFSGDFELICRLYGNVEFADLPIRFIDKRGSKVGFRSVVNMFFATPNCAWRMRRWRKYRLQNTNL